MSIERLPGSLMSQRMSTPIQNIKEGRKEDDVGKSSGTCLVRLTMNSGKLLEIASPLD
jgi:hypothetical protein